VTTTPDPYKGRPGPEDHAIVDPETGLIGPGPMPSRAPLYVDASDFAPHPSDAPDEETPPPPLDPHIDSLDPATAVVGVEVTVRVLGSNFDEGAVVEADQAALPTVRVSDTELTVTGTPLVDGESVITVRNGNDEESNGVTFTVTVAARAASSKKT
jgi:hypothetical protein